MNWLKEKYGCAKIIPNNHEISTSVLVSSLGKPKEHQTYCRMYMRLKMNLPGHH